MLLNEFPSFRQDTVMMRSYMFLLDFLEAVGKETSKMLKLQQNNDPKKLSYEMRQGANGVKLFFLRNSLKR